MSRILHTKAIYISILAIGALFIVLFLHSREIFQSTKPFIIADTATIPVTIADTEGSREQGLSGTTSLTPHTGKLFIFDKADMYGFWMKDMLYPLDIIWIDSSWKVVDISRNVTPESYPNVFKSAFPAQYVLEINANESEEDSLSLGTQLQFQK